MVEMDPCKQKKGLFGYCKESLHPGDHDNGKVTWPRTGSDLRLYLMTLEKTEQLLAEHRRRVELAERHEQESNGRSEQAMGGMLGGQAAQEVHPIAEGDVVRLVKPFVGDSGRYPVGTVGFVVDPGKSGAGDAVSAAESRLWIEGDLRMVLLENGKVIGTTVDGLRRTGQRVEIAYGADGTVSVNG